MKLFPLIVLRLVFAWQIVGGATAAQEKGPKQSLSLSLEAVKKVIPVGAVPILRLTIENKGKADEKVLKPRPDLQDTYYDLKVTKDGKPLSLGRAVSDPGPTSDEDFLTLKPGKTVSFEFSRYAVGVHYLTPGKYESRIRFWQNPLESHTTAIMSPVASFTVRK